jgi:hypothetical protein
MSKNASIYVADPSMLGSRVFDLIDGVQSYESISNGSMATGVRFAFSWGSITMNFMPPGDIQKHLNGFSGYAQHVIQDRDTLIYTLARIRNIRMVIGCVIEVDDTNISAAANFLFAITHALNGLLFAEDSIFDFSGERLGGPEANDQVSGSQ